MMGGPMRRGGQRGGRRNAGNRLGEAARQRLMEAHELYKGGQYGEAASKFEEMAGVARDRGMSQAASHLSAKAAAAHAQLGDASAMQGALDLAISDARQATDKDRSARTFGTLMGVIRESSLAGSADEIEASVRQQLGVAPRTQGPAPAVNRSMRRQLPQRCASCGAPVSGAEVRFNEDGSADCNFCGSILTG